MEHIQATIPKLKKIPVDGGKHHDFNDASKLPYQQIEILGYGRQGVVDKVKNIHTNSIYARKTIQISPRYRSLFEDAKKEYRREILITRRLAQHHHMVRVVESYSTKGTTETFAVILEPAADGGDLKNFLDKYTTTDDPVVKSSMRATIDHAYGCLASGLVFMHHHKIRHRDIKPENILLHGGSVLYADFGVSRDYSDRTNSITDGSPGPNTPRYCAPEVKAQENRTWKTDIFSLGCVFLLLYTAVFPSEIVECVAGGIFYEYLDTIADELKEFKHDVEVVNCMKKMLVFDQKERPSAAEVVNRLKEDEKKYFCQRCLEEPLKYVSLEDPSPAVSSSISGTTFNDYSSTTKLSVSVDMEYDASNATLDEKQAHGMTQSVRSLIPTSSQDMLLDANSTQTLATLEQNPDRSLALRKRHDSLISTIDLDTDTIDALQPASAPPTPASMSQSFSLHTSRPIYNFRHHRLLLTRRITDPTAIASEKKEVEYVLHEDRTLEWTSQSLGLGVRISKRKPYGSILPSLHTFPVVPFFDYEDDLVCDGSVLDVQHAFAMGKLHPYVQDSFGQSLLHLAIRRDRLDICNLLLTHGLSMNPMHNGRSLFLLAMQLNQYRSAYCVIEKLRFLLSACHQQPDFDNPTWIRGQKTFLWHEEVLQWLSTSGSEYIVEQDKMEELCLKLGLRKAQQYVPAQPSKAKKIMDKYLTKGLVERIKHNELTLVDDLFIVIDDPAFDPKEAASFTLGALWLETLVERDVDIVTYLIHELDTHPDNIIRAYKEDRKLLAGVSEDDHFVLGYRLAVEHTPGSLIAMEFKDLGSVWNNGEWPFAEDGDEELEWEQLKKLVLLQDERFKRKKGDRRKAKTKSRALPPNYVVPGSWID